jgi:hypothetical protein
MPTNGMTGIIKPTVAFRKTVNSHYKLNNQLNDRQTLTVDGHSGPIIPWQRQASSTVASPAACRLLLQENSVSKCDVTGTKRRRKPVTKAEEIRASDVANLIHLLTATGLTPGGSSTVHIYTQTIHRTTQLTNWEECGPCPVFASYTLAYALQLRKKHGKTSVRVAEEW